MIEELPTHQAGDSLGAYELVGELARGGMGVVYRAFHAELERDVALKVLDPRVVTQELIRRLRREAAVAARLSHPGIIAIQEFGSAPHPGSGEPVHFIVMDLIEGGTLSERIDDMSLEQRIDVLRQVSEAVGFSYGQ